MVCSQPIDESLTILVVDDHRDTLRAMSRLLGSLGFRVRTAQTLRDALAMAGTERYDLLISDLSLPDGNGWDLVRQVNAVRPTRAIALSGHTDDGAIRRSLDAGFAAYLTKPADLPCLLAAIQQVTG